MANNLNRRTTSTQQNEKSHRQAIEEKIAPLPYSSFILWQREEEEIGNTLEQLVANQKELADIMCELSLVSNKLCNCRQISRRALIIQGYIDTFMLLAATSYSDVVDELDNYSDE